MNSRILGLMSGTSLDGLDLCLAQFEGECFQILTAETVGYDAGLRQQLSTAEHLSGLELTSLDRIYGRYLGLAALAFLEKHKLPTPDAIASHGHTIFHQPAAGFTLQIGHGASLAAVSGLPVICDFRSLDVALGGQGAPLVPIGDLYLFNQYQACLNLGGFANISLKDDRQGIVAFDICACNIVLNHLSQKIGSEYDAGGHFARSGTVKAGLLAELNNLAFFSQSGPRSLGKEWVVEQVLPLVEAEQNTRDALCTFCHHIASQIARICSAHNLNTVLVTGGGAYNTYLLDRILNSLKALSISTELVVPDKEIIDFKEALIFAYLGHCFLERKVNALASVTGAKQSSIGGCLYNPGK